MSKHEMPGWPDENDLIVTVSPEFFSRSLVSPTGWPRLIIDYGGAALVLDAADLRDAETFTLGLARSSLSFASHCRFLIDHFHN
jgi:hypothetical protein